MTNHTHRFRTTLLAGIASIGILLALYGCGGSDDPSPSTQFTLSGQVNRSSTFTRTDLQAFPPTTQSQGPVSGSFTGVSLWTLLTDAKGGGDLTTNPQVKNDFLRKYFVVMGSDGTKAVVAVGEIHPNFGNQPDLVAYDVNGQALDDDGFAQLVVPRDQSGGRYVANLVSLEVRGSTAPQVSLGQYCHLKEAACRWHPASPCPEAWTRRTRNHRRADTALPRATRTRELACR